MMVLLLIETFGNPFGNPFVKICATEGFTVDCMIVCCNIRFLNFGVVKFG